MISDIEKGVLKQNHKCIAKAITLIDNQSLHSEALLSNLFPYMKDTFRVGITGPPGCGKSTLTDKLINEYRKKNLSVAILCIDPTSPYSGGAILGDRIRMSNHASDDKIFIRSLASKDASGGLSPSVEKIACLLDAAGFDIIIFETVGVGQIEVEIVKTADSILVLLNPESGDEIQMLKAGLMEIGDIFVINKSDRDGADKLLASLKNYLPEVSILNNEWMPRAIKTIAIHNIGVSKLVDILDEHQLLIQSNGKLIEKYNDRYIYSVKKYVNQYLNNKFWTKEKYEILKNESLLSMSVKKSPKDLANSLLSSHD